MSIKHQLKSASGFTLIELLTVIAMIAVISVASMPGVNAWRQRAHLSADMRRLYGFFQQARIEAVKRNTDCFISSNQIVNGIPFDYISFIDSEPPSANNNGVYDAGEDVIYTGDYSNGITLFTAPFANSFDSRGLINANATITLSNTSGSRHDLVINTRGKMRIR